MGPATFELIAEIISLAPQLIATGVNISSLLGKTRTVIDQQAPPDDAAWQALDAQVRDLQVGALRDTSRDVRS